MRGYDKKGIDHPSSKLTEEDVRTIYKSSDTNISLAKAFGVTDMTVSRIRRGITWKHVTKGL